MDNKRVAASSLAILFPILAVSASRLSGISDFLKGFILGLALVIEVVLLVALVKNTQKKKED